MKSYPIRDGLPIPVEELALPLSHLDLENEHNFNRHHYYYSRKMYESSLLLTTLRSLESSQVMMPKDQHNIGRACLHSLFSPPRVPKPARVMEHLEQEKGRGTRLIVGAKGHYHQRKFDEGVWGQLQREYNQLKGEVK